MGQPRSVITPGMQEGAQALLGSSERLTRLRQDVANSSGDLSATWSGQAANSYARAMQTWDKEFGDILRAMDNMRESLLSGRAVYDNTEDNVNAGVNNIQISHQPFFRP